MKNKALKQKLLDRELTIGSWLTFHDPAIAEIVAMSGFDWLTIDVEHNSISMSQIQELIRVIDLNNVTPLVRVARNESSHIKRFMDAGAHGVIVPMVNTKEEAEKAVSAVKYPPEGTRGVGLSRAQKYSLDLESYKQWNKDNSIVIVQIEHIDAVENFESIMSVKGVDGFIIGPYDLSGSLNVPGEFDNPVVKETLNEIYQKAKNNGYLLGEHIVKPDYNIVLKKVEQGVTFIGFGTDFLFLGENCRKSLKSIKSNLSMDGN